MVQTKAGATRNEWLKFLRECSSEYLARKNGKAVALQIISEHPCTCREHGCGDKIATVKGDSMVKPKAKKGKTLVAKFEPA
jgi:hypothetical protein